MTTNNLSIFIILILSPIFFKYFIAPKTSLSFIFLPILFCLGKSSDIKFLYQKGISFKPCVPIFFNSTGSIDVSLKISKIKLFSFEYSVACSNFILSSSSLSISLLLYLTSTSFDLLL
jgi:hypothetical protein